MARKTRTGRKRPAQHTRKLRSGRRISVNIGVPSRLPEGVSKKQARDVISNTRDEIVANLKRGRAVRFNGIGSIQINKVKAKPALPAGMRFNPFTGKDEMAKARPAKPASRRVKIIPTKILKDAVN